MSGIDHSFLDPVIHKVWEILAPFYQKAECAFKPVVMEYVPRLLQPLGIVKAEKKAIEAESNGTVKEETDVSDAAAATTLVQ